MASLLGVAEDSSAARVSRLMRGSVAMVMDDMVSVGQNKALTDSTRYFVLFPRKYGVILSQSDAVERSHRSFGLQMRRAHVISNFDFIASLRLAVLGDPSSTLRQQPSILNSVSRNDGSPFAQWNLDSWPEPSAQGQLQCS